MDPLVAAIGIVGNIAVPWLTLRQACRSATGVSTGSHDATTLQASALYPWQATQAVTHRGILIGTTEGGSLFAYDPWELYRTERITSPNMVIMGQLGVGKSALVKSYLWRQHAHGRRGFVVDPKGEFGPLAEAAGGTVIRFDPDSGIVLNPLDAPDDQAEVALAGILSSFLERSLRPVEQTALRVALRHARSTVAHPTLSDVRAAMFNPDPDVCVGIGETPESLLTETKPAAHALWNLCEGPLGRMLDGPTSAGIDLDAPIVTVDISGLGGNDDLLKITMASVLAWLHPALTAPDTGQKILVMDEAWRLLSDLGMARWLQSMSKLSRQYGLQEILVLHRVSDLAAAGADGAETTKIALGLLADCETKVVYRQAPKELPGTQQALGLNDTERDALPQLPRGVALWKVGTNYSALVLHQLTATEHAIVDTDSAQRVEQHHPADDLVDDVTGVAA